MSSRLVPLISACIIVALQIIVAPIIALYGVVPSFIVAFVVVLTIVRRPDTTYVYAFVLGLIAGLFSSQTPLGLTPLLLLIASFMLSRCFEMIDKTNLVAVLLAGFVTLFFYELIVAIVILVQGYPASFFDLLIARVIPATLFNAIIAVVLYFIARKFPDTTSGSDAWAIAKNQRYR